MNNWKIPLYKIYTDEEDLKIVASVIRRGNSWALGAEIGEFENAIKNYVGTAYCVAVNSGTSALHAALLSYHLGSKDNVIVPSFSFISTANAVLFVNANPIFADIEKMTLGLDPKDVSAKINSNTKAIIPVDYAGMSCQIFEIKKIAEANNLILIEDAAESIGATVNKKKVGSISDCAIFSFSGNKLLTTGEGGAIVTNSKDTYEQLKLFRSHGRLDKNNYFENPSDSEYMQLGYNWRISSLTAALGISQITKLDKLIKMRQDNANYITKRLSKIKKIKIPTIPEGYTHVYQMYTIRLPDRKTRDGLHDFLIKKRIFSKVYFYPIHLTDFYIKKFGTGTNSLPTTEEISQQVLTLPLYPNMTSEEKEYLVSSISEYFESG